MVTAKIVAHRGASAQVRENTLEAFELAIKLGVDYIELDVHSTSDGVLVVNHDPMREHIILADTTYDKLSKTPGCETIPTLQQVLEMATVRVKLYVEIKALGYEKAVVDMLLKHCSVRDIVIISFHDEVIAAVKAYKTYIRCGLLLDENYKGKFNINKRDLFPVPRVRACGADFMAPRYFLPVIVIMIQSYIYGIPLYLWTINKPGHFKILGVMKNVHAIGSGMPKSMNPILLKTPQNRLMRLRALGSVSNEVN